ncbi:MAG TPA: hypothetical protein VKB34_13520, partial [Povalibacter sp.]|nr:hypothetical protein [Povalibacter sp.]
AILLSRICIPLLLGLTSATALSQAAREGDTVLFVCEHGSVKSVMAATLFEQEAKRRGLELHAMSRGLKPDTTVPPGIVAALRSDGIDVSGFTPQQVNPHDASGAVRVVAIGIDPSSLTTAGTKTEVWSDVPDSTNYPAARAAIQGHIEKLLDELQSRDKRD